ncbi:DedA family protein [Flavihumibacter stibioxidans]|nr:VTT domain-containing protein [Flavihumibacter stibioxidans]
MINKFKGVLVLLIGLLPWLTVAAQQEVRVRFLNQYESPVKTVSIQAGGVTGEYVTDDEGYAIIKVAADETVQVSAENYEAGTFVFRQLPENKTVVLTKIFTWKDLLNPMFYIANGGLWMILLIVFAETGLFAGFFLPGDSLLFVSGIYSSNLANEFYKSIGIPALQNEWLDLFMLVALISFAGVIGNTIGYWFGRRIGPAMFRWKDNFFFKKHYLEQAHEFYDKHGGGAIVFARFLPIVRTFAPIIAGIVGMDKKKFAFYNIVGSIAWVLSMILGGHFLQIWVKNQFGFELKDHLEVIIIVIVLVTTAPVLWKLITGSKKRKDSAGN